MINRIILSLILVISFQPVFSQEKTAVDYRAQSTNLIKVGDSSVVKLIGDVFLYHNGAVISCDTAYRYSEQRIEAFGNVIINQDSLYVYGDKVIYNGETEIAKVFSSLIKVVDGDAIMYTRGMIFNTKEKIGYFSKGATMQQGGNLMEAESGTYNTQTKVVVLDDKVAMENEEYVLKTKTLRYDQNQEKAFFNQLTNIWNIKGEYLQADNGYYDQANKIYFFEKNSYILTKDQECWADSLTYYSTLNEVLMRKDIQLNDTVQSVSSFGDYGYFWSKSKDVLMTKNPSMFSYEQTKRDTSFVRADTILVTPFIPRTNRAGIEDNIMEPMGILDSLQGTKDSKISLLDSIKNAVNKEAIDSLTTLTKSIDVSRNLKDSISNLDIRDELEKGSALADSLKNSEIKEIIEESDSVKKDIDILELLDIMPNYNELYSPDELNAMGEKELKSAKREMRRDKKRFDREVRRLRRDEVLIEQIVKEKEIADSLENALKPVVDSLLTIDEEIIEIENVADSSDMIVRAYGNAKIYKLDMQSIADSLIVETVDSTNTSIGKPVAWNGLNQITAKRIRSYVVNGAITRTRMFSNPIVAQYVGVDQYNQMKGDYMDALYRNSEMRKLIVMGNSISRFFREEQDAKTKEMDVVAFVTSKSTNMIIDMDSSVVTRIKWIEDIETYTYPMDQILEEMRFVEGFEWLIDKRPKKEEVFNRVVRPSVRAEKESILKPNFNITKSIFDERRKLLKQGVWTDRNDKLKIDRTELVKQSLENM